MGNAYSNLKRNLNKRTILYASDNFRKFLQQKILNRENILALGKVMRRDFFSNKKKLKHYLNGRKTVIETDQSP